MASADDLESRLQYYAAGETVQMTVQVIEGEQYVEKTVEVTLGRASEHTQSGNIGFGYYPFGGH